jgi:hypothetical protein
MKTRIASVALAIATIVTALTPASAVPAITGLPVSASNLPVQPVAHRHGFYRVRGVYYYNGHRGVVVARPGYRYHRGYWFPAAAFAAGAAVGAAVAAPPPAYYRRPAAAHVAWCYETYRSYRAWDNSYQPYEGPRRQCWSPYS